VRRFSSISKLYFINGCTIATGENFNSEYHNGWGYKINNSRTKTGGTADSNGIVIINSGSSGITVDANANSGIVAKSINAVQQVF
jgi:hypothetical protein